MAELIADYDWASTPLGAIESWPQSLKTAVDIMLGSGHAMQLAWGPERTVLYNDAYAPMLGGRHPAALGMPFRQAWPEIWEEIEPLVARVFAGETVRFENLPLVMTRKGYPEDTWWNFSYSPVWDEAGNVAGLLNVTADATARMRAERAEAAVRESERRQAFFLQLSDAMRAETDAASIGAVALRLLADHLDLDRCYFTIVHTAEDQVEVMAQYRRRDLLPIPPTLRPSDFPNGFRQVAESGLVVSDIASDPTLSDKDRRSLGAIDLAALIVASVRKKPGHPVWALVAGSSRPRAWAPADITSVQEAAERIWAASERAAAEEALRENQRRLEEASRAKDQFLAMLGHELRNPLAPIVTTLELMKMRAPDTLKREREVIASQTNTLVDMVDDLLDVARITRGDLKLDKHPLLIGDVVAEAAKTAGWALSRHRQVLHTRFEPGLTVLGDRRRLEQVLVNLLVNAAKYSPPDRSIDIDVTAEGEAAVIRVRDQGIGMGPELRSRVFDAFTQAEQQSDRRRGGLGLGLAIVRNIVELHDGSVAATSEGEGRGSEFVVRLPLLRDGGDGSK